MKNKLHCTECNTKSLSYMKLFDRYWCSSCKEEIDIDKTIQQWATKGYQPCGNQE